MTPRPITTDEWKRAKLPFEGWLRYTQGSDEFRTFIEQLFDQTYPTARCYHNLCKNGICVACGARV